MIVDCGEKDGKVKIQRVQEVVIHSILDQGFLTFI